MWCTPAKHGVSDTAMLQDGTGEALQMGDPRIHRMWLPPHCPAANTAPSECGFQRHAQTKIHFHSHSSADVGTKQHVMRATESGQAHTCMVAGV